ncbi:hypothetical protein BZA77DRAFT_296566 [Pyronema omphalodes]|nr:hypothetical protein BZA77DRAFT_296566 [Pyronema omphalodes]
MQPPFSPAFSLILLSSALLARGYPAEPSTTHVKMRGNPTADASPFPRSNSTRPDLWCNHSARTTSEQSWCDHPAHLKPDEDQPKVGLLLPVATTTGKLGLPIPLGEGGCAVCITSTAPFKPKEASDAGPMWWLFPSASTSQAKRTARSFKIMHYDSYHVLWLGLESHIAQPKPDRRERNHIPTSNDIAT